MMVYPYKIMIIKVKPEIRRYCGIYLWSHWEARVVTNITRHKIPRVRTWIHLKKDDSPLGEIRMRICEVKFLK